MSTSQSSQATGALQACQGWIFSSSSTPVYIATGSGQVQTYALPAGVGLPVAAGTQIEIAEHLVNPGSTPLSAGVQLNVLTAPTVQYAAGRFFANLISLSIPPSSPCPDGGLDGGCSEGGLEPTSVGGTCTAASDAQFFWLNTEMGAHAKAASIGLVHGGQSTVLVQTGSSGGYPADQEPGTGADWQHPGVGLFCPALEVKAGDSLTFGCSYVNASDTVLAYGESSSTNDWCIAIGYYFPVANTGGMTCNR